MCAEDGGWMAYIDAEVRALRQAKRWGHQIRRKWSVREKPVCDSAIDDYEWKLIPDAHGRLPEVPLGDFEEGVYYVLTFNKRDGSFVFQHSTSRCGMLGPHWERTTYTEIEPDPGVTRATEEPGLSRVHPPVGWLRDHLEGLVAQFAPNSFSAT